MTTFTDPSPVVVGTATKKSYWDKVYDNTFWLRDHAVRTLDIQNTKIGNAGLGSTLMSYTLPGGTVFAGRGIRASFYGSFAANGNTKGLRITMPGYNATHAPGTSMSGSKWRAEAVQTFQSATEAALRVTLWVDEVMVINTLQDALPVTWANAYDVKALGQVSSTANDILQWFQHVEII